MLSDVCCLGLCLLVILPMGCTSGKPERAAIDAAVAAVDEGHFGRLAGLLDAEPSLVHFRDSHGGTLLHMAAWHGRLKMAELLLSKGAGVNAKARDGTIPLHVAAYEGHREIVELFVAHGADVNAEAGAVYGMTPLEFAAMRGLGEFDVLRHIARLLIENGADVNHSDSNGWTALHHACDSGKTKFVELLLKNGANPNAVTKVTFVEPFDAPGETPLHMAIGGESALVVVELLIANGANVNVASQRGETPLHRAAKYYDKDVVRALIEHGAALNAEDKDGNTPLAVALSLHREEVVEVLRQHGATE